MADDSESSDSSSSGGSAVETMEAEFTVPGKPKPQRRPKPNYTRRMLYDLDRTTKKEWRMKVPAAVVNSRSGRNAPVVVSLKFYFKRKASHFRKRKGRLELRAAAPRHHTYKPDVDNLVKLALDAMNGACYADDKVVVKATGEKLWTTGDERTEVVLKELA